MHFTSKSTVDLNQCPLIWSNERWEDRKYIETKENKTTKIIKHTHTYYIFYYLHWLLCVFFYCSFIQMYTLQRNSWFNLNTYCSYRNTAFKNIHYWNKVINLKLGPVLSFTTEIIYNVPWIVGWVFFPPNLWIMFRY